MPSHQIKPLYLNRLSEEVWIELAPDVQDAFCCLDFEPLSKRRPTSDERAKLGALLSMMRRKLPFDIDHEFNQERREYRKGKTLTQEEVAELIFFLSGGAENLDQSHISNIEKKGGRKIWSRDWRILVARAFCIPENTDLWSAFVTLTIPVDNVIQKYFQEKS